MHRRHVEEARSRPQGASAPNPYGLDESLQPVHYIFPRLRQGAVTRQLVHRSPSDVMRNQSATVKEHT
jgi:hypothetical protein